MVRNISMVTKAVVATFAGAMLALTVTSNTAHAYQQIKKFEQPESRTEENAMITVIVCDGPQENGGQFYIYQYLSRPGFRAIRPPNWSDSIGGRDYPTFELAADVACRPR